MNPEQGYAGYGGSYYSNPWGSALSAIGGGIGSLFSQNPANAAEGYLNGIPNQLGQYMNPYINAGSATIPTLQNQYSSLMNGNFINNMGKNFQQSPGYQFQVNQALNAANRAAAAGGSLGSPMEQQQIAGTTSQLANQDYYNWLDHAMGAYGLGLNGMQNMYGTGANMANSMAEDLAANAMSQANLAYAGQQNQNQSMGGGLGSIFGGLGSLFGMGGSNGNGGGLFGDALGFLGSL